VIDCYDGNWELGSPIDGMVIEFCTVLFCSFLHAQEQDWISGTRFRWRDEKAEPC